MCQPAAVLRVKIHVDDRGQRTKACINTTETQTTTCCNRCMEKSISACTTPWTDEQQKTTRCAPPLSAKNTKWMPQLTQAQQNWAVGDWENIAWSFFLLQHSDGWLRIWSKQLENMNLSFVSASSLHLSGLHSTFGMCWNGRFSS